MAEKRTSQERFLQTKMYDVTLKLDPADVKEEIKTNEKVTDLYNRSECLTASLLNSQNFTEKLSDNSLC